jgi:hypothetical protein
VLLVRFCLVYLQYKIRQGLIFVIYKRSSLLRHCNHIKEKRFGTIRPWFSGDFEEHGVAVVGAVEDDHVTAVKDQYGGIGMVVSLKFGLGKKMRLIIWARCFKPRPKYSDGYFAT